MPAIMAAHSTEVFALTSSRHFPGWLASSSGGLAFSTYQAGKLFFLGAMFVVVSLPVTAPMVLAADRFAAAMKRSPRVTRVVDYLFAGVFSAFALKIITAQAK